MCYNGTILWYFPSTELTGLYDHDIFHPEDKLLPNITYIWCSTNIITRIPYIHTCIFTTSSENECYIITPPRSPNV